MRHQLEMMMDSYHPIVSEQKQQTYFVVGDLESLSASALYNKDIKLGINLGNYSESLDLGKFDSDASGYSLSQRFDTTHDPVHLNQEVFDSETGETARVKKKEDNPTDGYRGLGPAHKMDLNIGSQS